MRFVAIAPIALALAACGRTQSSSSTRMQLLVPEAGITMKAGETRTIQVLAVTPGGTPATISAPELPGFATLDGDVLTLAPARSDMGEHSVTVVARTDTDEVSRTFGVSVLRENTAPKFDPWPTLGTAAGTRSSMYCPGSCTIDPRDGRARGGRLAVIRGDGRGVVAVPGGDLRSGPVPRRCLRLRPGGRPLFRPGGLLLPELLPGKDV